MTRIIALLLALMMTVCCFSGCSNDSEDEYSEYTYTSEYVEGGEDLVVEGTTSGDSGNTNQNPSDVGNPGGNVSIDPGAGASNVGIGSNPADKNAKMPKIDFDKKVTICIDWDPKSEWVVRWEKSFKKSYPGHTVSYKQATPDMKASKLAVWANSGQSPDAIFVKPEESWPDLVNKKLVTPVDEYIDIKTPFWTGVKGTMDSLKISNKYYALVCESNLYGSVIYNPTVIKNAGLEDPQNLVKKNAWTWSNFEKYAKKLTKINSTDPSKSKYGVHIRYGEVFIPTTGKDLIEYSNGKWISNLNNNNVKSAIDFLRRIGPTGQKLTVTEESDPSTIRKMTVSGQVAMYVTAEAPSLEFPNEMKKGTLKHVPIPKADKASRYYAGASVGAFYVPKGAKNPKGGVAYACAVRGFNMGIVKINTESIYTKEQLAFNDIANSKIVGVPLQFRRLGGTVEYYNIYGPTYLSGDAYSGIVAEWEPKILEALKKQ